MDREKSAVHATCWVSERTDYSEAVSPRSPWQRHNKPATTYMENTHILAFTRNSNRKTSGWCWRNGYCKVPSTTKFDKPRQDLSNCLRPQPLFCTSANNGDNNQPTVCPPPSFSVPAQSFKQGRQCGLRFIPKIAGSPIFTPHYYCTRSGKQSTRRYKVAQRRADMRQVSEPQPNRKGV